MFTLSDHVQDMCVSEHVAALTHTLFLSDDTTSLYYYNRVTITPPRPRFSRLITASSQSKLPLTSL